MAAAADVPLLQCSKSKATVHGPYGPWFGVNQQREGAGLATANAQQNKNKVPTRTYSYMLYAQETTALSESVFFRKLTRIDALL